MIRIAVIDDHALIIEGVRRTCADADPPIEVVATFEDPRHFLTATPAVEADAVVLDLHFDQGAPHADPLPNLAAVEEICKRHYRVVILSHADRPDVVLACLDLGVSVYLSKREQLSCLTDALHEAVADRPYRSSTMTKAWYLDRSPDKPKLSNREEEVLRAWFQTDSKILVARKLFLSVGSVDTYLARIRTKYAAVGRPASSKAALVARAIKDGLITPDDL